ncbi:chymotrypsin-1-like [Trichogramma pretiosum]|uniref:chymotrypsin-1-like n=1 Tax=Trichogramma pretiosum TaxID=7493 RepID=UPI0006C988BC|nr:chymotrypsin-1-like [Trichogramma pretiosum]
MIHSKDEMFISVCDATKSRIIEGLPVNLIEDYPFQVSYQYDSQHVCGGSILNKRYVLMAAHCVEPWDGDRRMPEYSSIRVGSLSSVSDGEIYEVEELIVHPLWKKYVGIPYWADLALIKLKEDIEFSEKIQPTKLAEENDDLPDGSTLTLLGWGFAEYGDGPHFTEEFLLSTKMKVYNLDECQREYKEYLATYDDYEDEHIRTAVLPNDRMICLVGEGDFCSGDSGGPVVDENNIQFGVLSFNLDCGTAAPVPSGMTDVRKWIKWIKDKSEESENGIETQPSLYPSVLEV